MPKEPEKQPDWEARSRSAFFKEKWIPNCFKNGNHTAIRGLDAEQDVVIPTAWGLQLIQTSGLHGIVGGKYE